MIGIFSCIGECLFSRQCGTPVLLIIQAVWNARAVDGGVELSHVSPDGDEKYPGEVHVNVTYLLTDDNQLTLNYRAIVIDKATPISMTSHPYFNLAGEVISSFNTMIYRKFDSLSISYDSVCVVIDNLKQNKVIN